MTCSRTRSQSEERPGLKPRPAGLQTAVRTSLYHPCCPVSTRGVQDSSPNAGKTHGHEVNPPKTSEVPGSRTAGQWRSTGGTPELAWVPSSDGTGRRTGVPKGPPGEARGSTRLDTDPLRPTSEPAPGPLRPRRSQGVSSWSTWLCRDRFKDY